MNKQTIRNALQRAAGGAEFINRQQIKAGMGWGNDRAYKTVEGLSYITQGRNRQYDIDEVAARIYQQVEVGV